MKRVIIASIFLMTSAYGMEKGLGLVVDTTKAPSSPTSPTYPQTPYTPSPVFENSPDDDLAWKEWCALQAVYNRHLRGKR